MLARALHLTIFAIALACSACGLRGPLYLPDDQQQTESQESATSSSSGKSQRRPAPAPQSQKRDRDSAAQGANPTSPHDPDRPASTPAIPPGN